MSNEHNEHIHRQFDPRAEAYLASAVHAEGDDLRQMAALVGQRRDAVGLDMGCGGGHVSFCLAPLLSKVVACDLSASMLAVVAAEAKRRGLNNVATQQAAVESLPLADVSFDVAVSRYSAHHWQQLAPGLAQLRRVVKDDGLAIFMDVISPGVPLLDTWLQSLELLRDPSHNRDATLAEWCAQLCAAGFRVDSLATYRLRLEFSSWVARMKTPASHIAALRSLQQSASRAVLDYFAIEDDGSFTVDTMLIAAKPVG